MSKCARRIATELRKLAADYHAKGLLEDHPHFESWLLKVAASIAKFSERATVDLAKPRDDKK